MGKRRRRGSTSPPLVGIEPNPGPMWRKKTGRYYVKYADRQKAKARKKLSPMERGMILMGLIQGLPGTQIARLVGISTTAVRRWRERYKSTRAMERKPGSGKHRKLTPAYERYVRMRSKRNRFLTASKLAQTMSEYWNRDGTRLRVSRHTISRRLNEVGLKARAARKKPMLTKKNRLHRIAWARKHKSWDVKKWQSVVWSDETAIQFRDSAGRTMVRRLPGESPFKPGLTVPTIKKGGGKINIWSCFSGAEGLGPVREIEGTMDGPKYHTILTQGAISAMRDVMTMDTPLDQIYPKKEPVIKEKKGRGKYDRKKKQEEKKQPPAPQVPKPEPVWWWQEDNDPKHRAHKNRDYLERKADEMGFGVLDWPSQSPDLNPIENLWRQLKVALRKRELATNKAELLKQVNEEWDKIKMEEIQKLIASMPKRCRDVLKNHGGPISY